MVAWGQGDYVRATELHTQSLELAREMQDTLLLAWSLGDYARAAELHRESLPQYHALGDRWGTAECLEGLAWAACAQGEDALTRADAAATHCFTRAARLLGAAEVIRNAIGAPMAPSYRTAHDSVVAAVRAHLGATVSAAWDAGRALSLEQAVVEALTADTRPPTII
jgi:hypothetical protein